ncbi:M-phase inducer phosphatase 2-like [Asterias rubens]|uniref:M-phase inducer phosphatase 2-like n=1 Tax=Asterias rubens TaxID=7604 RepID=UPI0014558188|nr:M-phase inducer phosphatase 2-like [Asterias rubens]
MASNNTKRKDMLGLKKRSLSLKFGQKEDMPFSPLLPTKMGGPTLASPMTTLSAFMGELNCEGSTPKRRLSLSSTGDTPVSSRASSQSSDLGQPVFYIGSPTADESPFAEQSSSLSAFRRYNSLPSPQAAPDPPVFLLSKEIKSEEGSNGCLATEVDEKECQRKRAETIMWEACNDQENIDVQRKIETFKTGRPRQISFIEAGTFEATTKERPISAPASLLEQAARPQTTVLNSPVKLQHCRLVSSNEDEEDGFTELFMDSNEASESAVPGSLCSLLSAPMVISPPTPSSDHALRDLDCNTLDDTPNGPKCRRTIFKVPSQPVMRRSSFLKRADRPRDTPSPVQSKRYRSSSDTLAPELDRELDTQIYQSPRARRLGRSHSMDEGRDYHQKVAMALNCDHTVLTGDRTKPDALPLCDGKHRDLKSITPETMCRVLRSEFPKVKEHFILDCRYPYEYKGGHIKGAMNLYTKDLVRNFFLEKPMEEKEGRVIIFHCEFSSKRGPDLLRFLRNKDRDANIDHYPTLYYPELYILYGGYKAFYENDKTMCEPQTYLPMEHEDYREDCKTFKAKSKSWAGERSRLGHRKTSVS